MKRPTPAMDTWKTAPFELGRGEDACLLLHGFTGSPWDMRPLGEALAARGLYVRAPRLPGHGTTPEALLHVGWRDWEAAAHQALQGLRGRRHVFVAGLSMGALLALRLAARAPEQVRGLALLAPAIGFTGLKMRLLERVRRHPLLELLKPWVHKSATDISDPVARAQAPVLPAFPIARLDDLFTLQAAARADASRVRSPTLVAVAEQDHVVDPEGGQWLLHQLAGAPVVRFLSLREGYHIIPRDTAGPRVAAEVGTFFESLRVSAAVGARPSAG